MHERELEEGFYGAVHVATVVSAATPVDDLQHHTFPAVTGAFRVANPPQVLVKLIVCDAPGLNPKQSTNKFRLIWY